MRSGRSSLVPIFSFSLSLIVAVCALGGPSSASPQTDCQGAQYPVTKIGVRKTISAAKGRFTDNVNNLRIDDGQARYLRVQVEVSSPGTCGWYLTVRNESSHLMQTLTPEDFKNTRTRWTMRIPGKAAIFELQRCQNAQTPDIKLTEYIQMPLTATNTYYSSKTAGAPDFKPLYADLSALPVKPVGQYQATGDYVGLMMSSSGSSSWVCSGVLVAPDLFLTNWHCGGPDAGTFPEASFWSETIVKDTIIDLSFDDDEVSREYAAIKLEAKSMELDFALLRITPINPAGRARAATISLAPIKVNDHIQIIHHPSGEKKRISFIGCNVVNAQFKSWKTSDMDDFTHRCDTERGSSGAPVFNSASQLIGLHHLGYESRSTGCDNLNKAVRIGAIIDLLQSDTKTSTLVGELQVQN